MARKYTKVQELAVEVFERKAGGETNREISESFGLTLKQVKQLIARENRRKAKLLAGKRYAPRDVREKQPRMRMQGANRKSRNCA